MPSVIHVLAEFFGIERQQAAKRVRLISKGFYYVVFSMTHRRKALMSGYWRFWIDVVYELEALAVVGESIDWSVVNKPRY